MTTTTTDLATKLPRAECERRLRQTVASEWSVISDSGVVQSGAQWIGTASSSVVMFHKLAAFVQRRKKRIHAEPRRREDKEEWHTKPQSHGGVAPPQKHRHGRLKGGHDG